MLIPTDGSGVLQKSESSSIPALKGQPRSIVSATLDQPDPYLLVSTSHGTIYAFYRKVCFPGISFISLWFVHLCACLASAHQTPSKRLHDRFHIVSMQDIFGLQFAGEIPLIRLSYR